MKSKSFLSILGVIAFAIFAVFAFLAPRETLNVLAVVAVTGAAVFIVANLSRQSRRNALVSGLNTLPENLGTSKNSRRYRASAAITTRYLLGKAGADDEHIAVVAATSDKPIGVITDEAAAAEDPVNVELLGVTNRTLVLVAAGAIAVAADVYATAAGKVDIKPTAAGTYWRVGVALTAPGAANDPVEVATCRPRKLIVLAALTNTSGDIADTNSTAVNPVKTDFDSLLTAAGKLQADFLLLAAALNADADVAYATT